LTVDCSEVTSFSLSTTWNSITINKIQASTSTTYTWSDVYVSPVDACFTKSAYFVSHNYGPNLISYPAAECAESPCRSVDIVLPTGPDYTYLDEYDIEIHYSPKEGSGATLAGSELIKTV
jgi:hypothetical protein